MRNGLVVIGLLLLAVGLVWIGQGLGYIKGSFMTGDMKWFWIGCALVVVGIVLGAAAVVTRRGQSRV